MNQMMVDGGLDVRTCSCGVGALQLTSVVVMGAAEG